jgi:hypothetical protein
MNALDREKYEIKMLRRIERAGGMADSKYGMYLLMQMTEGWPDVDDWAGSTLREWWNEETNGWYMLNTLRLAGFPVTVHPTLATADEIRAAHSFEDFVRTVTGVVYELGLE